MPSANQTTLRDELQVLNSALARLQVLVAELPWADWQPVYDQIGARRDAVKVALALE